MTIPKLQSLVEKIDKNSSLYEEKNFEKRMEAIEFIEFQVIDQMDELSQKTMQPGKLAQLKLLAENVKIALENINDKLFQKLRTGIQTKEITGERFENLVHEYVDFDLKDTEHGEEIGYENLDILINGLTPFQNLPQQTRDLEPEMVYYQKTPARIVFELIKHYPFSKDDVFFDLGSGLGHVAILVNLITGICVRGIEIEPAFCDYARNWASYLKLSNLTFLNMDARLANFSEGTVFFLFTPFKGKILAEVLEKLRKESVRRRIKIMTYGPCTSEVDLADWLSYTGSAKNNIYQLSVFNSLRNP